VVSSGRPGALPEALPHFGKNLESVTAFDRRLIEHGDAVVKLLRLGGGERQRVAVDALAKRVNEVQTLLGGQMAKVDSGHL
jgi:hypothetical protein